MLHNCYKCVRSALVKTADLVRRDMVVRFHRHGDHTKRPKKWLRLPDWLTVWLNVWTTFTSIPKNCILSSGLLIRNLGIPTGGNWLKYLFPNLGFGSPAYSQSGNWFPHEFPQVGFDWNLCSRIWDLVLQLIPKVGIDSHRNSHWKELIEIFESVFFFDIQARLGIDWI